MALTTAVAPLYHRAAVPSSVSKNRDAALAGVRMELHRYFGLPFYRAMFEAAGFAADVAAYDVAAPDVEAQKRSISEEFIDHLCAIGTAEDVRRGVQRYRDAGVTNPVLTGILGTNYDATLRALATDITAPATA